jgi:exodeoxyribonuclease V gamma subunit
MESLLQLYQSNRLENLFAGLCEIIAEPAADPLAAEVIVVQNPGMARWLSQHIALQTGIAANLAFPLPATFFWEVFKQTLDKLPELSELSAFDRDVLLWRIFFQLDSLPAGPAMAQIATYLQDDADGSKKFQLAAKITDLFDQYLVYRPDMILAWEQGKEDHWQAVLWRKLTENHSMHRAALLQRFSDTAAAGALHTENLPERICFFGINSLAPAYLEVIARISPLTAIHIFQLSPCRQAWDDILPERLLALKRQSWRNQGLDDISSYFTSGNPLLASMGATGREFFSQLMQLDPLEIELYEAPESRSLLTMIQNDNLDLHDRSQQDTATLDPEDTSIRFHCCHGPMREVQVLHDRLLDLFAADPALKPADILVMAPDINLYAPAVAGVFGAAGEELRIPWSIADRSQRGEQPVIDGFLGLLELVSSRFTAPEVVVLLENQAILRRFELKQDDLSLIRSRILAAGIRWGLDREQRRQQGMDDSAVHTWEFGIERLLLGYITGPLTAPFQDIMPCSAVMNDSGPWLGGLTDFIRKLQRLQRQLGTKHSPASWSGILLQILTDFFDDTGNSRDREGLLMLRETISDFSDCCEQAEFSEPVSLPLIRSHFAQLLAEPAGGQAFLSGRGTFCNMVPMRSVPFKVIWLLGMNDMDYPRSQRPPGFDLIAQEPRLGDRSRRDDDRYLFLEALLSAREQLSISWVGRDQQENSSLPPSVVVAELRDYISRAWQTDNGQTAAEQLTVEYPLQPFSRHCFDNTPNISSYADVWLPAAGNPVADVFISKPLPRLKPDLQQVDIGQLIRFWNHPVRFFLEQRLGLHLGMDDDLLPESEAFSLNNLERYLMAKEITTTLLAGEDPLSLFHRLQAGGELPMAGFGRILFQDMQDTAASLAREVYSLISTPVEPCEINLSPADLQLTGWLSSLYSTGRISYRPATLKPKDILQLWIHHLVLSLVQPAGVEPISVHAATNRIICFRSVDDPEAELAPLLHYYRQGMSEPLHFYPATSHAWAQAKKESARMNSARRAWHTAYKTRGEEEDPAYTTGLRGLEPLDEQFEELAPLFFPILDHMEEFHAAA